MPAGERAQSPRARCGGAAPRGNSPARAGSAVRSRKDDSPSRRRRKGASKATSEKYSVGAVRARFDKAPVAAASTDSYSVKAVRERMKSSSSSTAVALPAPAADATGVSCRIIIHSDHFCNEPVARVILAPRSGPQLAEQLSENFHDAVCRFVQVSPQASSSNTQAVWGQFVLWLAEQHA